MEGDRARNRATGGRRQIDGDATLPDAASTAAWTPEEDAKLVRLQDQLGNKWAEIAKQMQGRSSNNCKSRFPKLRSSTKE